MSEAIEKEPNNPVLYYNLGVVSGELGEKDVAISYYEKSIELDPSNENSYLNLVALILDGEYIITAIHEFVPRLPWFVYKYTQAKAHLLVMRKFEKHLNTLKK